MMRDVRDNIMDLSSEGKQALVKAFLEKIWAKGVALQGSCKGKYYMKVGQKVVDLNWP